MHIHVCKVYRFLHVSTIFLLDLGNVPTMWYFSLSIFLLLDICTTDGTSKMCNLFVKTTRGRGSHVIKFNMIFKDHLTMFKRSGRYVI